MKKAIFTIMIGHDPSYSFVHQTFQQYANKVNAEFICVTQLKYGLEIKSRGFSQRYAAWFEKIYMKDLLEKYDRVLYLDADILINPHAPDIFLILDNGCDSIAPNFAKSTTGCANTEKPAFPALPRDK